MKQNLNKKTCFDFWGQTELRNFQYLLNMLKLTT